MDLETGTRAVQPTPASNENLKLCRGEIEAINANLASCDELARDGFLEGNECAELKSKLMKELDAVKSKYGIKNVPVESQQQSCQPQAPVTQPPLVSHLPQYFYSLLTSNVEAQTNRYFLGGSVRSVACVTRSLYECYSEVFTWPEES